MQNTDFHLESHILHYKNHHWCREGAENPSCGWIAMDMGNIVLHMLDQVHLVPSLYVLCCQHTCQNGYSLAKKVQTHIFPCLNPHLACINAKNRPHAMRSWQRCKQYVWRDLQPTCICDNERMRKLFCRNEENFTILNPCGRWEPSLMMRPGCRFFLIRGIHYWDLWVKQRRKI